MSPMRWIFTSCVLALLGAAVFADTGSIINSKHNLSASGPGAIRATSEQEVCIFCHTPHHAAPVQPLWNRNLPSNAYKPYASSSLVAAPGQPTGSSKLCLSCHDGTIAVGAVVSRAQPIAMTGGVGNLPPGPTNLGTDLSGDHPISFRYDSTLATKNTKLKDPSALPAAVHVDPNHELQCTSCHDAHDNTNGHFLVMDNSRSQLCTSCHNMGTTDLVAHQSCTSCHQNHKAPSGPWLLRQAKVADTCLLCHNGSSLPPQGPNVAPDLTKISMHETHPAADVLNPIPNTTSCHNCHEPHTMRATAALAPTIPGNLGQIGGVTAAGAAVKPARYEYEVCFTCHGDQNATQPYISRKIAQSNTRLQFSSSAVSYHPVEAAGKNTNVPSLRVGYTAGSIIYCHDCHASDTSKLAGGTGANGTHGSNQRPLLVATYLTADQTSESATAYALCYRCHDRTSILSNASFKEHNKHIVDQKTPCSICHDGHGISSQQGTATNNAHLINFDNTVVQPHPTSHLLQYQTTGTGHGNCTLLCHGKTHTALSY